MSGKSEQPFSGGVFSDQIDGGRAGAGIELSNGYVSARTVDGEEFSIAYGDCQVEIGGFSGRMVFCRNQDRSLTIFCEDRGFAEALTRASGGILAQQVGEKLRGRRTQKRRARMFAAAVILSVVGLLIGGYWGIRAGANAAVHALPVTVDRQIGTTALKSMDLGGPEINDQPVVEAVQTIVDRLSPHAAEPGMEFNVHVVDSPVVNAFALPGGEIVVFTGLIEQADDAEQVAGVISHEMAHATLRHGLQRIGQSLGLAAAINLLLGDTQGLIAAGAELFQVASINSYSRNQENAADQEGVRMLHAAGIDPTGLIRFFENLKAEHGELPAVGSWLSTHPQHEARIAAVKAQLDELPSQEYPPLEVDWDEMRRRIAK